MADIKTWKQYLKSKSLYSGDDTNSDVIDTNFKSAMINLESKLSTEVPSIKGLIWQNNSTVNPQISPADYDEALKLLQSKKQQTATTKTAQATLDEIGSPNREESPLAFKWKQTQEDSKLNSGDPNTCQNHTVMVNPAPNKTTITDFVKEIQEDKPKKNVDDRMLELTKLIESTK